jgi:hypothetical protein
MNLGLLIKLFDFRIMSSISSINLLTEIVKLIRWIKLCMELVCSWSKLLVKTKSLALRARGLPVFSRDLFLISLRTHLYRK